MPCASAETASPPSSSRIQAPATRQSPAPLVFVSLAGSAGIRSIRQAAGSLLRRQSAAPCLPSVSTTFFTPACQHRPYIKDSRCNASLQIVTVIAWT